MEGGEMVELVKCRWMLVAMAMAALTTGCAVGEAGAEDIDMDDAEAVEVEESSQAVFGYPSRTCGGSWSRGPGSWGWGGPGGLYGNKWLSPFSGWGSNPFVGGSSWGGNGWNPYGGMYGSYPFSPYGAGGQGTYAPGGCSGSGGWY
ncbi:hypothetical protein [Sorangium sp. So ce854]|uniref:hypothetical protein n=1 Tax=Sorangium sp. So ce854 TaxID=3133322 RepID=UPI003F609A03